MVTVPVLVPPLVRMASPATRSAEISEKLTLAETPTATTSTTWPLVILVTVWPPPTVTGGMYSWAAAAPARTKVASSKKTAGIRRT